MADLSLVSSIETFGPILESSRQSLHHVKLRISPDRTGHFAPVFDQLAIKTVSFISLLKNRNRGPVTV